MNTDLDLLAKEMEQLDSAMEKFIEQAGTIAGIELKQEARHNTPVDTGALRKSITEKVSKIESGVSILVQPSEPYAYGVEFGQPPGTYVSPEALKPWARRHGMSESAAYAISRKIMAKGTDPQPFLFPAFEAKEKSIFDIIGQGVYNALMFVFKRK